MSEKQFDNVDMINYISEAFVEGYKFAVEVAVSLEKEIEKKYLAKHKKVINSLIEDMKKTAATIDKETLKKVAEDYIKEKHVEKEILDSVPATKIYKPSLSQIKRLGIQRRSK